MKKFKIFLSSATYAQTTKGTLLLGGNVSISSISTKLNSGSNTPIENSTSTGAVSPAIGIFMTDNLALGLTTGLSFVRYRGINNANQNYISRDMNLTIWPYARLYKVLGEKISLFGSLTAISYGLGKTLNKTPNALGDSFKDINRYNNYSIGLNVSPGIVYFINSKWGIEAMFGNLRYN